MAKPNGQIGVNRKTAKMTRRKEYDYKEKE
jgi:hypothetical protein